MGNNYLISRIIANIKHIGLPNRLVYFGYEWNPSRDENRRFGDGNKDKMAVGEFLPLLFQSYFGHGEDKFAVLFALFSSMLETELAIGTNILVISLSPIPALAFETAVFHLDTS